MAKKNKSKKNKTFYRQCRYQSPCEGGYTVGVAWIPEHLAVVDKTIVFPKSETPDRLWTVTTVSKGHAGRIGHDFLMERSRDHLTQRQASDI